MFRQKEAVLLAEKADLIVVVGGRNSSNTKKLVEICETVNTNTIQVEEETELEEKMFENQEIVGVVTGASTPNWIIRRVITKIRRLGKHD